MEEKEKPAPGTAEAGIDTPKVETLFGVTGRSVCRRGCGGRFLMARRHAESSNSDGRYGDVFHDLHFQSRLLSWLAAPWYYAEPPKETNVFSEFCANAARNRANLLSENG